MTTVRRVARPRGELTRAQIIKLQRLRDRADTAEADYRSAVVEALATASFTEVRRATGHSTATLQQWKKDHSDDT